MPPEPSGQDVRTLTKHIHDLRVEVKRLTSILEVLNTTFVDIAKAYMPMALQAIEKSEAEEQEKKG